MLSEVICFAFSAASTPMAPPARGASKSEAKVLGNRAREKVTCLTPERVVVLGRENLHMARASNSFKHNHGVQDKMCFHVF